MFINQLRTIKIEEIIEKDLKQSINEKGYKIIENFIQEQQCEELINYTSKKVQDLLEEQQKDKHLKQDPYHLLEEDKIHLLFEQDNPAQPDKLAHALHDLDPFYEKFCYQDSFAQILNILGYKRPSLVQTMYIYKSAKNGSAMYPHKDNTYLKTYPKLSTIGFWIALHDSTQSNGCLWGVPGSHTQDPTVFMERDTQNGGAGYKGEQKEYQIKDALPLEVKRGGLIIFDGNFVHFSKNNYSELPRNAFTLHFAEFNDNQKWDSKNWLQRNSENPFQEYYTKLQSLNQ